MKLKMKRKFLIFGMIMSLSVFGITRLGAADYYGKLPAERLLASIWDDDDDDPIISDADGDGIDDLYDMCPNLPGDKAHCGCPAELVTEGPGDGFGCVYVNDPDDPNNCNDCTGVPVGGGLLLLLGSALVYGATVRRRSKNINLENNN
jgi:hypothetical protein